MVRIPDDPEGFGDFGGLFGDRPATATGADFGAEVGRALSELGAAAGELTERLARTGEEDEGGAGDPPPEDDDAAAAEAEERLLREEARQAFHVEFAEKDAEARAAEAGFVRAYVASRLELGGMAARRALEGEMSAADAAFGPQLRRRLSDVRQEVFGQVRRRHGLDGAAERALAREAETAERGLLARAAAGAHNARVLRVAGEAEAEIDGLADALRRGAVELATARDLARGFVAARNRVVPDPVGLFAEDASRRLTQAFAEGLMARRPYEAEGLIAGGILKGGGLTREESHGLRVAAGQSRRRAEARAALMLEEEIRRGRAGAAEVAAAVETGEIPAAAAAHLEGVAAAAAASEARRQTGAARIAEVLVGRAPQGDPDDPGFRQAVEAYAESLLPEILASLPPEATARIAAATGAVPARALLHVVAGLAAEAAPARRVQAILTVAMTDAQAPGVLDREAERLRARPETGAVALTARDLAFARATAALVRHGIPPGEAARIAEARMAQTTAEPGAAQSATEGEQNLSTDAQAQPASFTLPVPRGGELPLPGPLPPPVPPEAMEKLLDSLTKAFPDIPVGEINRALNALFLELFVRGRLPAGEEGGDGEREKEKQRLPARPGETTPAEPPEPQPPQPPDPTSALPTPSTSERKDPRKSRAAERFTVGTPDDVLVERTIVQPTADREQLLRQAENERLHFEAKLQDIAADATGTDVVVPRVKARLRLQEKIDELQKEMRKQSFEAESPDAGANLIRDYLAGKLVPKTQGALDAVMQEVRRRFEVVDIKNYMQRPNPQTGYTAIHIQVKLPNGMTAELQVQPEPFKRAAEAQRDLFEKWRRFGKKIPVHARDEFLQDMKQAREAFAQAWDDWLRIGGKDVRVQSIAP